MCKAELSVVTASVLVVGLFSGAVCRAEERTLTLSPEETEVTFLLGATGHDVHGVLHLRQGVLLFDPVADSVAGDVVIDAKLTETGNDKRDKTMHAKVLQSVTYPLLVFHARAIEGELAPAGHSEITLVGTVTMLGKDHPLRLPAEVDIDGDAVSATATFPVPFVEWGLHDPSTFILKVAKTVEVKLAAKGSLAEVAAAPTAAN